MEVTLCVPHKYQHTQMYIHVWEHIKHIKHTHTHTHAHTLMHTQTHWVVRDYFRMNSDCLGCVISWHRASWCPFCLDMWHLFVLSPLIVSGLLLLVASLSTLTVLIYCTTTVEDQWPSQDEVLTAWVERYVCWEHCFVPPVGFIQINGHWQFGTVWWCYAVLFA